MGSILLAPTLPEQNTGEKEYRANPALGQSCPNLPVCLALCTRVSLGIVSAPGLQNKAEGAQMDWRITRGQKSPITESQLGTTSPFPVLRDGHGEPEQRLGLSLMCREHI